MKMLFFRLCILLTGFAIAGCGLKGPLYFPPAEHQLMNTDVVNGQAGWFITAGLLSSSHHMQHIYRV